MHLEVEECVGVTHFYVDILDAHESNYEQAEQNISIDPTFQAHLQSQEEGDISKFLALLEIIPDRQRKRQQPLLDYSRSQILMSTTYTKGCERLLAWREATQAEAKRKQA